MCERSFSFSSSVRIGMYLATAQPKLLPELRVAKVRLGNCQTMKRANTCGGDSSAGMYLVPINLYRCEVPLLM